MRRQMRGMSLFTGSGIGDYAAEQCGIETVVQCENDPACLYCLEWLFPGAIRFEDVHDVSATALRQCGIADIDIISGGFPCQDLSCAGKGTGIEGSRSGLWREMFRVIRQVRPRWILVENVPAIKLRGVDRVIAPLERIGYTVWPLVVGAWSVGAPHKRDRVWIVGRLADCNGLRGKCGENLADAERTESRPGTGQEPPAGQRRDRPAIDGTDGELADTAKLLEGRRSESSAGVDAIGFGGTSRDACRDSGAYSKGSEGVADAASERREGIDQQLPMLAESDSNGRELADTGSVSGTRGPPKPWREAGERIATRWPSRPGCLQEQWERPRLIEQSLGCEFDGFPARIQRRANKTALRILGNAWCYPLALLLFRWIARVEDSECEGR